MAGAEVEGLSDGLAGRSRIRSIVVGTDDALPLYAVPAIACAGRQEERIRSYGSNARSTWFVPGDSLPDPIPMTLEPAARNDAALLADADVLLAVYDCEHEHMEQVESDVLPLIISALKGCNRRPPVVVLGFNRNEDAPSSVNNQPAAARIVTEFDDVEACAICSSRRPEQLSDVRNALQRSVLHPIAPLFDRKSGHMTGACQRALKRIFLLSDRDNDGHLSDSELNDFQNPLQDEELSGIKAVANRMAPNSVTDLGMSLSGFMALHEVFVTRGRPETTWTVLRRFGYDKTLRLRTDIIARYCPQLREGEATELTDEAVTFLSQRIDVFHQSDKAHIAQEDVNKLFSTAPRNPVQDGSWIYSVERNKYGQLSKRGFLSMWHLVARDRPEECVEYFIYLGWPERSSAPSPLTKSPARWKVRRESEWRRKLLHAVLYTDDPQAESTKRELVHDQQPTTNLHSALAGCLLDTSHGERALALEHCSLKGMHDRSSVGGDNADVHMVLANVASHESTAVAATVVRALARRRRLCPLFVYIHGTDKGSVDELIEACRFAEIADPVHCTRPEQLVQSLQYVTEMTVRAECMPMQLRHARLAKKYRHLSYAVGITALAASVVYVTFTSFGRRSRRAQ